MHFKKTQQRGGTLTDAACTCARERGEVSEGPTSNSSGIKKSHSRHSPREGEREVEREEGGETQR